MIIRFIHIFILLAVFSYLLNLYMFYSDSLSLFPDISNVCLFSFFFSLSLISGLLFVIYFALDSVYSSCFFFVCLFFCLFRDAPAAHGVSQARGLIRAVAAGLCQSHSNTASKLHLQPTPQLTATPDP